MTESVRDMACDADAISLVDVANFLVAWWKVIFLMGAAATLAAWFYLKMISPMYQAQTIIAMAKVPASPSGGGFIDIETPDLLAERISLPTAFSVATVKACEFDSSESLVSHLKIISHNKPNSTLRFAVQHYSPRLAEKCVGAIFEMIREQQAELAMPVFEGMRQAISDVQRLLQDGYSGGNHRDGQAGVSYIYFERSKESLFSILAFQQKRQDVLADVGTRMLTPIYASEDPVSPRKLQLLLSWGSVGLFCGLLIGLVWNLVVWFRRRI